jgi:endonuclease-3
MNARLKDVSDIIRPCGAHNRKSQFILEASRQIIDCFMGQVPSTMDELITLSGVSRKTANVILSVAFDINEGVVVDTHIMRVTQRLGLTAEEKNRNKIERELMNLLPNDLWGEYARLIGAHGRRTCSARNPKCAVCPISKLCPSAELFMK